MCEHDFVTDYTIGSGEEKQVCLLCGEETISLSREIDISFKQKEYTIPRKNESKINRLTNFTNIMNLRSGKQSLSKLGDKKLKLIEDVVRHLYGENYNERKLKDVLKKLKMYSHINNTYLIFCILKKIPCLKFDIYEPFFEYIYLKMYDLYVKLFPYKYFISTSFFLSKLLEEVGITVSPTAYYFKNIRTFEIHNNIYDTLRKQIPMTYQSFSQRSPVGYL